VSDRPIDADNDFYEPLDAITRHLPKEFRTRGVQTVVDGRGHTQLLVGGRLNRFVPNPTFDPVIVPGCLDLFFRGQIPDDVDRRTIQQVEPLRPGVPVAFHLGDSGYNLLSAAWGGSPEFQGFGPMDVLGRIVVSDRAIHDTIASLVVDGVFARHPALRVASIENGSDFLHLLVKRLRKQANQTPWVFREDPLDTIREHVWVAPYFEEDLEALAELMGTERILFGSDWPHGEGLAIPLDFAKELGGFDEAAIRRMMRDNCLELLGMEA
jgi:predicted TIM-barrel fold metal-dependent hydrolase